MHILNKEGQNILWKEKVNKRLGELSIAINLITAVMQKKGIWPTQEELMEAAKESQNEENNNN